MRLLLDLMRFLSQSKYGKETLDVCLSLLSRSDTVTNEELFLIKRTIEAIGTDDTLRIDDLHRMIQSVLK